MTGTRTTKRSKRVIPPPVVAPPLTMSEARKWTVEVITGRLNGYIKAFDKARAEFMGGLEGTYDGSLAHTLNWRAEDIVRAEFLKDWSKHILAEPEAQTAGGLIATCQEAIHDMTRSLLHGSFRHCSTGQMHNSVEEWQALARCDFIEQVGSEVKWALRSFEKAIPDPEPTPETIAAIAVNPPATLQ